MNAEIVYQVTRALPKEERKLLFDKLKEEFLVNEFKFQGNKKKLLNKNNAIHYLLKNVFC